MTLARRLSRLEESLCPTELVVRWITEAHSFGSIEAYVASLVSEDPPTAPLDRLARETVRSARVANRGKRPEVIDAAIRAALRETVFRYELVLRINVVAHELLDREAHRQAAISARLGLLFDGQPMRARTGSAYLVNLARCCGLAVFRAAELNATDEARRIAQDRYLAGHEALFPQTAEAWAVQLERTQTFASLVAQVAEAEGLPTKADDPDGAADHSSRSVVELVEPARAAALEKCGEPTTALRIATEWLRGSSRGRSDVA